MDDLARRREILKRRYDSELYLWSRANLRMQRVYRETRRELQELRELRGRLSAPSDPSVPRMTTVSDGYPAPKRQRNSAIAIHYVSVPTETLFSTYTDRCSVCYDEHIYKEMMTTCCDHIFCRPCFGKHVQTRVESHRDYIDCPLCRGHITHVKYFRKGRRSRDDNDDDDDHAPASSPTPAAHATTT
jgi:hypothetical protein